MSSDEMQEYHSIIPTPADLVLIQPLVNGTRREVDDCLALEDRLKALGQAWRLASDDERPNIDFLAQWHYQTNQTGLAPSVRRHLESVYLTAKLENPEKEVNNYAKTTI
jgi:hypothetical protein